jgi:glutamate dehydrogenase (NADP+)
MFGQYKRLRNEFTGVLTGKEFRLEVINRPETGYGAVYFAQSMLETKGDSLKGSCCFWFWKRCSMLQQLN